MMPSLRLHLVLLAAIAFPALADAGGLVRPAKTNAARPPLSTRIGARLKTLTPGFMRDRASVDQAHADIAKFLELSSVDDLDAGSLAKIEGARTTLSPLQVRKAIRGIERKLPLARQLLRRDYPDGVAKLGQKELAIALLSTAPAVRKRYAEAAVSSYVLAAGYAANEHDDPSLQLTVEFASNAKLISDTFGVELEADKLHTRILTAQRRESGVYGTAWGRPSAEQVVSILATDKAAMKLFGVPSVLEREGVRETFSQVLRAAGQDPAAHGL